MTTMTDSDWQIIERVAKIHGFTIHPNETDFPIGRRITDRSDINRSAFYWNESEGFDEFFLQIYQFGYDAGYETATRW